jgi:shikimate kinase
MNESKNTALPNLPIFIVGFMGAGKTTVGRTLAQLLNYPFIDLDEVITAKAQKTVREIFAEFGEAHFRELEREAIQACGELKSTVVALGGGAYVAEENRTILRELGKTIWLDCPLEICLSRIVSDGARPLAKSAEEMRELLDKRLLAYTQADIVLRVESKSAEEVAKEIIEVLLKHSL